MFSFLFHFLRPTIPLNVVLQIKTLAIKDAIGTLLHPIAQDEHPALGRERKVEGNVAMAKDEVIDVRMIVEISLGKAHKMLAILAHERRFAYSLAAMPLTAVLRPIKAKIHSQRGMNAGKEPLTETIVEDGSNETKHGVGIAKAVTMSQIERLVAQLDCHRLTMENNATLFL